MGIRFNYKKKRKKYQVILNRIPETIFCSMAFVSCKNKEMFILTRNNFSIFYIFSLFHLAANRRGGGWKIHEDETTALGKNVTVAKYIARLERKLETKSVLCSSRAGERRTIYLRLSFLSKQNVFFLRSRSETESFCG